MKPKLAHSRLYAIAALLASPSVQAQSTYFWDDNAAGANFGTAGASLGTWAGPTAGTVAGWSLSTTGANAFAGFTTTTADTLNFGNGATGLGAGTITVDSTVASGNMTFAAGSGAIVLSGGSINFAAATSITVNNTTNTISSAITGAGTSLTKAGTGRLILSGTSTSRTGGTSITGGNLTVAGTGATTSMLGTGAITWATTNTTLQLQSDSNISLGNAWTTSGRNLARTLVVDRLTSGDANALTYTFSSQFQIDTGSNLTLSAGSNITSGTSTVNFSGGIHSSDSNTTPGITLTPNGVNFRVNGFTNTRARTITLAGNSANNEMYGAITQSNNTDRIVNVIKSGTSTWTLSGTSAAIYGGGTSITGGTLVFRNTGAKSSLGTHVFNANTTLGLGVATSGAFFTSADVDQAFAGGTLINNLSNVTVTATTSVGIDTTAGDFTYATSVTGSPTKGLTKLGTNVLTLSGTASTYTGATTIRNGTLSVGLASNLSAAAANLVFDGGTLRVTGNALTSLTDLGRTNAVVFNPGRTVGLDIADAGNTFTVGQVLNQTTGGFTKSGAGTAILNQTNTYTGPTTVNGGALSITSAGSLASGNALTVGASGTADFANVGQTLGAVSNANTTVNALNFSAATGTITLASLTGVGNTRFGSIGTVTGGISTGTVTSVGALNANISGGTVTAGGLLTGTISAGTVGADSLSSSSVTGGTNTITGAATITTLNGGATTVGGVATITTMTSGTANLNGATSAITTLNGGTVNLGASTALSVSGGTSAGNISGSGSLTKTGMGVLTLTGTNSHSGATNVDGGTLLVTSTGSLASGSVTIASGAAFRYNSSTTLVASIANNGGSVTGNGNLGAITLAGTGTVDPGNSPGILTVAATNPTSGLDYNFEMTAANTVPTWSNAGASVNDVLRLTDPTTPFTASLGGTNTVALYLGVTTLTPGDIFTGGFYTDQNMAFLASVQGADFKYYLSDVGGVTEYASNFYTQYSGPLSFQVSTTQIASADFAGGTISGGYVTRFMVVPEPSTALLGGLGMLLLLRRRRN